MNSSGASVLPQLRVSSRPQWQPAGEQTFWLLALVSLLLVFLVENAVLVPFTAHINYLGLPPSTCFWWNLKQDESAWLRKDEACRKQRMWSCGGDLVQIRAQFNPPEPTEKESRGVLHVRSLSTGECCLLIVSAPGREPRMKIPGAPGPARRA